MDRVLGRLILVFLCLVGCSGFSQVVKPAPGELVPWQAIFQRVAGPSWTWRAAQVRAESGFNPYARSGVGAQGGAQFMPKTWSQMIAARAIPPGSDPHDPKAFIPAQHYYMTDLESFARKRGFETDRGIRDAAHGSYNAGPGSIQKAKRLADSIGLLSTPGTEDAWLKALPRVTGQAHSAETQGYVARINKYHSELEARCAR